MDCAAGKHTCWQKPHAKPPQPYTPTPTPTPKVDAIQLSGSCHGPVMMRRLWQLKANVMNLGQWALDELFPSLMQLGPFKDTLGPR